jgi:DNA-binding transcriptional regulator LsrR (DeoR family)
MNNWDLDKYLDVLELRYVKGLTFEVIGKKYNISKSRAKAVVEKAKRYVDKKYYYDSLDWL